MPWFPSCLSSQLPLRLVKASQVSHSFITIIIVKKGRGAALLKPKTQKKRTLKEMEETKTEEEEFKANKVETLKTFKKLKTENLDLQGENQVLTSYKEQIKQLQEQGYIDKQGTPIKPKR